MDRREALKKLGMGGVTVVGASMIVSSPVFGLTTPVAPTPGVSTITQSEATFSYTLNNPECTGGSDPVGAVALVSASLVGTGTVGGVDNLVLTSDDPSGKFKAGDVATLTVSTTSTCVYSNLSEDPVNETFVFSFEWLNNKDTNFTQV